MIIPKQDWIHPKIEIKTTGNRGRGMFATEPISQGEVVVIWGGTYVHKEEAAKARAEGKFVMQFDDDLFSVEEKGESDAYFINHSCDSNVWMKDTFSLEATREIIAGEELTADYAMWEIDEHKVSNWECSCGSLYCRHRVTGKDWQIKELQERYKGHFLPFITKKIENLNT